MYTTNEFHDACLAAASQCPQFKGFDDDAVELVNGKDVPVGQLPTQGIEAVIAYWRNTSTVGGAVLFASGYAKALPADILNLFGEVDKMVAKAIHNASMEYS